MDLSQFLDVTCDEGEGPLLDTFTEEDIVLLDDEPMTADVPTPNNGKRVHSSYYSAVAVQRGPPMKKVRRVGPGGALKRRQNGGGGKPDLARTLGLQALSAQAVGILQSQNITVKKINNSGNGARPPQRTQPVPIRPAGSITWKYKQLMENQYTADIRDTFHTVVAWTFFFVIIVRFAEIVPSIS